MDNNEATARKMLSLKTYHKIADKIVKYIFNLNPKLSWLGRYPIYDTLASEVMVADWKFDPTRQCSLGTYRYNRVRWKMLDIAKQISRDRHVTNVNFLTSVAPEDYNTSEEITELGLEAGLSPYQIRLLRLKLVEGYTYDELAARENIPLGWLKYVVDKAKKTLQKAHREYINS